MKLRKLFEGIEGINFIGDANPEILGVADDSRKVVAGGLFIAVSGNAADGHRFISQAVAAGASALLVDNTVDVADGIPCVVAECTRPLVGEIASRFYGNPSRMLKVSGVTGTNGKTSTTYIAEAMLKSTGQSVGVIGTINYRYADKVIPARVTTPGPVELQEMLAEMEASGVRHCVFEVSSHALDQGRVTGIEFDCAIFTNLSRDHLDYHSNMDEYRKAKSLLFNHYLQNSPKSERTAVINMDSPDSAAMLPGFDGTVIRTSVDGNPQADMLLSEIEYDLTGSSALISWRGRSHRIKTPLLGKHNLYNILGVIALGVSYGLSLDTACHGACACANIPGRLERVANDLGIHVFVDYSHTPDALEKTLQVLASLCKGRLICVFGCGGDRDRGKRPIMGRIAGEIAHLAVVTSDNPRTEEPESILDMIEPGIKETGMRRSEPPASKTVESGYYYRIQDRAAAIECAVRLARPGDAILIAGKGHEDYQIVGTEKRHFDDREEAARAMATVKGEEHGQA